MGIGRFRGAPVGALLAAALIAGCGDGDEVPLRQAENPSRAGGNGTLVYALATDPGGLDPLVAESGAARTVARQIFEPLVATLDAPYGGRGGVSGVALAARHSGDFRVWSLRLRPGVRFQDGGLLNAAAVVENAQRWRASPSGDELLPGLVAADAPRPNLVRFVFAQPLRNVASRLSDPRLGVVSPTALRPLDGGPARLARVREAGSGPFQLMRQATDEVAIARNGGWWGSSRGLGPALDRIEFAIVPQRSRRLSLLRSGQAQIAADPGPAAGRLRGDPLLTVAGGGQVALERSVRGIEGGEPGGFSGVWVAGIDRGA